MHKPEIDKTTKKPLEVQDKRSVVAIEERDFDRWLTCTPEEARRMIGLIPVDLMSAVPVSAAELREGEPAPTGPQEEELPF
ncbi:hypothetical protein [Variovorax sp. IB41]|uniref:hypothetical protein n=1 Tax=Variovorax sp. IB41 TaxID=2779370 RepID=UPI001E39F50E|nr:hypothetical protein [Variovorax sp. IB41]